MDQSVLRFPVEDRIRDVARLQSALFDVLSRYTATNRPVLGRVILHLLAKLTAHPEVRANPLLHLGYLELELHWQLRLARETNAAIDDELDRPPAGRAANDGGM